MIDTGDRTSVQRRIRIERESKNNVISVTGVKPSASRRDASDATYDATARKRSSRKPGVHDHDDGSDGIDGNLYDSPGVRKPLNRRRFPPLLKRDPCPPPVDAPK